MTAPWFRTRVEIVGARILVEAEVLGGPDLTGDIEGRLSSAVAEAVEDALDRVFNPAEGAEDA